MLYCILFFFCSANSTDTHKSAFLLAQLVVTGEIVIDKEAGISYKTVVAHKSEFSAYGVNCNAVELLY